MSETCTACGGTGINSRGGVCYPCEQRGIVTKTSVINAISQVYAVAFTERKLVTKEQLHAAIDKVFEPESFYFVVCRGPDSVVTRISSPYHTVEDALQHTFPIVGYPWPGPLFIVEERDGKQEPVARWKDGGWQLKK